jgi:hypothetical protein
MEIAKAGSPPSDPADLERLQEALYRDDEPVSGERRAQLIRDAALTMARHMRDPLHLIAQANEYELIRSALLKQWNDVPFENRMALREMALSIRRYETNFQQLTPEDQRALVEALPREAREVFIFSRNQNIKMAYDILAKLKDDKEVMSAPTVDAVWDAIKRLDPTMEEALHRPLDRSKFVERDLKQWPRRTG